MEKNIENLKNNLPQQISFAVRKKLEMPLSLNKDKTAYFVSKKDAIKTLKSALGIKARFTIFASGLFDKDSKVDYAEDINLYFFDDLAKKENITVTDDSKNYYIEIFSKNNIEYFLKRFNG